MAVSVLELLAERLGIPADEVAGALSLLTEEIRRDWHAGKDVTLPGLGTFHPTQEGLSFAPDKSLRVLANSSFTGLHPVSVPTGGRRKPEPETPPSPEAAFEQDESQPPSEDSEEAPVSLEEELTVPEDEEELTISDDEEELTVPEDEEEVSVPEDEEEVSVPEEEPVSTEADVSEDVPRGEGAGPIPAPGDNEETFVTEEGAFADVPGEEDEMWEPPVDDDSAHPLGPLPPPSFEDADFAVIDELTGRTHPAWETPDDEGDKVPPGESEENVEPAEVSDSTAADEVEEEPFEAGLEPEAPPTAGDAEPQPVMEDDKDEPIYIPPVRSRPPRGMQREGGNRLLWGLLLLIGLAGGAVVAYNLIRPTPPVVEEDKVTDDSTRFSVLPPVDSARAEPEKAAPPALTPPEGPREGLDRAAGGWTIVVASETSRAQAEAVMNQFRTLQVPVDVLVGTSNGVTRYRVAVGQYPGLDEARAAMSAFGDQLPRGAWPLRIR